MLYLIKDTDARQVVGGELKGCCAVNETKTPSKGTSPTGAKPAETPTSNGN